ncbi:MAG: carbohydrate kinase family protein [Acidimicrobiales bacterium]
MTQRYVAVGSICWDEVPVAGSIDRRLGGSVLFAARVALAAGWDVHVLTSGTEELEGAARAALPGVVLDVQRSPADTVMAFDEAAELGPQRVPTVAAPIDVARAADALRGADVVHLAPIMGEVTPAVVDEVRAVRPGILSITPQGLLRAVEGADHRLVRLGELASWWASEVDVAVLSDEEHAVLDGAAHLPAHVALAVTRGPQGCIGYRGDEVVDVAGIAVGEVAPEGTIGAGDTFAAALLVAMADGGTFSAALHRANEVAAAHVAGRPLPIGQDR